MPTVCRHASIVLWAQEWTTQRVAGFFLVDPGVDDSESGWLFPSCFLSAYCVQARFSCLVGPGVDDSESGWLFPGSFLSTHYVQARFSCLVGPGVNDSESGWLFPSSLSPWTLGLS